MFDFLNNNIDSILSFIVAGGLSNVLTLKYTKKTAHSDAMKSVQSVYQETIKDLRADKDDMKIQISDLRNEVSKISEDIKSLKQYKCVVTDCKLRKRY